MLFQANIWDEKLNKLHVFEESSLRGAVCDKHTVATGQVSGLYPTKSVLSKQLATSPEKLSQQIWPSVLTSKWPHPLHFIIFPFHTSVAFLSIGNECLHEIVSFDELNIFARQCNAVQPTRGRL